jgi:hypothetical protein
MKQDEINKRNSDIALMLRLHHDEDVVVFSDMMSYAWDNLKFHKDWNWLMEAVEFIEKLSNYFIQIEEKSCYIYDISKFDNSQTNAFIIKDGETKKEAVFISVSDFAQKFNNKEL